MTTMTTERDDVHGENKDVLLLAGDDLL